MKNPSLRTHRRTLVVAPTPFFADRGCHVRIYEEVLLLQQLGMEVEVCTYHLGRDIPGVSVHRSLRVPWYRKLGPGPSWHKPYLDLLLLWCVLRAALRSKPDAIHGHLHEGALIGAVVGALLRIPSIADYQGSLTREISSYRFGDRFGVTRRLFRWMEGIINRLPDHIVTCTSEVQSDLVFRFGVPEDRTTVVPDGVGQGLFRDRDTRGRKALGLAPEARVIVFVGVLTAAQGIDLLVESMARVLTEEPDTHLLVVGYPREAQYQAAFERRGIVGRSTFLGRVDYLKLPDVLALADLAVTPKISNTEGNGKLYNYMACALPVVAFDNPVNRSVLQEDGLFAREETAEAFATRVLEALREPPQKLEELGLRLQRRAREGLSWENNRTVLDRLYRDLHSERR